MRASFFMLAPFLNFTKRGPILSNLPHFDLPTAIAESHNQRHNKHTQGGVMRSGEHGEGRGPKTRNPMDGFGCEVDEANLEQIEYLLFQSTQGVHFIFENSEIAKILS